MLTKRNKKFKIRAEMSLTVSDINSLIRHTSFARSKQKTSNALTGNDICDLSTSNDHKLYCND